MKQRVIKKTAIKKASTPTVSKKPPLPKSKLFAAVAERFDKVDRQLHELNLRVNWTHANVDKLATAETNQFDNLKTQIARVNQRIANLDSTVKGLAVDVEELPGAYKGTDYSVHNVYNTLQSILAAVANMTVVVGDLAADMRKPHGLEKAPVRKSKGNEWWLRPNGRAPQ